MSHPNQPIYTLNDIKVNFSKKVTLNIPNFKFHRGAIYGITGPISSGKSTFLNLLSFNLNNFSGVLLFEENLFKKKWYKQNSTPEGILYAGSYPKPSNETIKEFLTRVFKEKINVIKKQYFLKENFSSFWDTPLKNLSTGQMKRLSLIYAIEMDPKVLLVDNYGDCFDRNTIIEFNKKLKYNSRSRGTTIILSTSKYKDVIDISNILLFLDKGHLSKIRSQKKINHKRK
tara:strand:- start:50999 stop:51685 length:687 start_codon:yes stop_codon:yes gene_type:complete